MKMLAASCKVLTTQEEINLMLKRLEKIGRVCYKSEDKITENSYEKFIKSIINRGHESVIEHMNISVSVVCDRGISHEIVRHRIGSYSQESTRYVNYTKGKHGNEITVIDISNGFNYDLNNIREEEKYLVWQDAMEYAEESYFKMIELGATPQEARSVLPNSTKTEINMTLNLRSWRNFFKLRCDKTAHPQMREIANNLLEQFKKIIPIIFDDIKGENYGN